MKFTDRIITNINQVVKSHDIPVVLHSGKIDVFSSKSCMLDVSGGFSDGLNIDARFSPEDTTIQGLECLLIENKSSELFFPILNFSEFENKIYGVKYMDIDEYNLFLQVERNPQIVKNFSENLMYRNICYIPKLMI